MSGSRTRPRRERGAALRRETLRLGAFCFRVSDPRRLGLDVQGIREAITIPLLIWSESAEGERRQQLPLEGRQLPVLSSP
jgi:hypothetical protein